MIIATCSSDRRLGNAFPAFFCAAVFLCVAAVNQVLVRGYDRVDGGIFGGTWPAKVAAYEALRNGTQPFNSVYVGDSTVESGAVVEMIDAGGFNLARSGFDPSRLPSLSHLLLGGAGRKPRYVLLSLTLAHMSEDAWPRPADVPFRAAFSDEAKLFYADTNSFKALLCGGCSYLHTLAEKIVDRLSSRALTPPPGAPPGSTLAAAPKLLKRDVNFRLVADFKHDLDVAGIKLVWVFLPLRSDYRNLLSSTAQSQAFTQYAQARLTGIFGSDIVDLRTTLPDSRFRDAAHADPAGARLQSSALGQCLAERYPGFFSPLMKNSGN